MKISEEERNPEKETEKGVCPDTSETGFSVSSDDRKACGAQNVSPEGQNTGQSGESIVLPWGEEREETAQEPPIQTGEEKKEEKAESLEELFADLDEILEKMESGKLTLDESFSLYESGLKKLKLCNKKLDMVEKKMLVLNSRQETVEF